MVMERGDCLEDLSGRIFGRLTVVNYAGNYKWNCKCSCGNVKQIRGGDLKAGKTRSCGCLQKEIAADRVRNNLLGMRFGKLVVESFDRVYNHSVMWRCRCDCGNEVVVYGKYLTNGDTKSCGCLMSEVLKERNIKHGLAHQSRLYTIWKGMRERCNNKNNSEYESYGGRGITVCQEWDDYERFFQWAMENGFDESLPARLCSIDRINNDEGYSPDNCRWVSMSQQARNTRRNRLLTYNGETKPAVEWGEIFGINPGYIINRIDRYGWSVEDAIATPVLPIGTRYGS